MAETPLAERKAPNLPAITSGPRGLQLNTMEQMWWFAQRVCASGLAPKGLDRPEAAFVAMQMGMELGLTPMASLQNIAVINGRPSVCGDAMPALCINSGKFDASAFMETVTGDGEKMNAVCRVKRVDSETPVERSFSVEDAKRAGLWGKAGPWTQYPKRMLQMRARSFALRDTFPDVLRGFISIEEAQEIVAVVKARNPHDMPAKSATEKLAERLSQPADFPSEKAADPVLPPPQEPEPASAPDDDSQIPAHERVAILLAETCGCPVGAAMARLETYCSKLYRKSLENMTENGLAQLVNKIRSGDIKV